MDLCACLYIGDFPPPLSTGDTALSGNLPALLRRQRIEWPQVLIIGRGNHLTFSGLRSLFALCSIYRYSKLSHSITRP